MSQRLEQPPSRLSRLRQAVAEHPPPGPTRRGFWRSPLRGPWLTSVFGSVLLAGIIVVFVTGLLSYAAYNPDLGSNDKTPGAGPLGFYLFDWPTNPSWLYRVTQGLHVTVGIVLIPVLLGKLWSVIPKLFTWPPVRSLAHALERLSLLLLVGGVVFEFVTGLANIQYWYVFPGSFYSLHFYGAWVFIAAFVVHVAFKLPVVVRSLRSRSWREELRTDTAHTVPEPPDDHELVSPNPAAATISRRGALALVGGGSALLFVVTAGQSFGGVLRRTALLAPRFTDPSDGPNGFQVNKTADALGLTEGAQDPGWRLQVRGAEAMTFDRDQLLGLPQHTAALPIACVEGWSTSAQAWAGVRLADLAQLAGVPAPVSVFVESLQESGFGTTTLRGNQVLDPDSLLALRVNGADLSLDHGFPARVIVPNNPGVHNTKWVTRLTFEA
ncbi:MAG: molybdopterin-dependent oxidoreductase [Nocardioidaceae bacterium]|nr:molybdopterin-dependent oxidoreductase [Nocardioidaceae bacterium]